MDSALTARLLHITVDVLAERGWRATKADTIARAAGSGKVAIYRRWADMTALVTEALLDGVDRPPVPDTGHLAGDLEALLAGWRRPLTRTERAAAALLGASQHDPDVRRTVQTYVTGYLQTVGRTVACRAADRGAPLTAVRTELIERCLHALYLQRLSARSPDELPAVGPAVLSTVLAAAT